MKVPLGLSLLKDVSNPEAFLSSRCRLPSSPSTPPEQKKQQDLLIEPASRHIGLAVNEHGTSASFDCVLGFRSLLVLALLLVFT